MIFFNFRISNPFSSDKFRSISNKNWLVFNNKSIEVEAYNTSKVVFEFSFEFSWRGSDHAGSQLDLVILGYGFSISFRDTRHWNYDKNCWYSR